MGRHGVMGRVSGVVTHFTLGAFSLLALFPVVYTLMTSFKTGDAVLTSPPTFFPAEWSLEGYRAVLFRSDMLRVYLPNTLINSTVSAGLVVVLAALSAYTFSRHRFRGSRALEWVILGLMMMPGLTYIIPYYRMAGQLNLLNTHTFIIAVYTTWGLPFAIWIVRSFIDSIPRELEEAALIDGCTPLQSIRYIVLPLAAPGLLAAGLIVFVDTWNEFLMAVVLLSGDGRTATVGLYDFQSLYDVDYHILTAACIVMMVPVLVIFLALHRQFFRAMMTGGLKG
jgi:ABC-type glycerol-3-phosphate transport system permease component